MVKRATPQQPQLTGFSIAGFSLGSSLPVAEAAEAEEERTCAAQAAFSLLVRLYELCAMQLDSESQNAPTFVFPVKNSAPPCPRVNLLFRLRAACWVR